MLWFHHRQQLSLTQPLLPSAGGGEYWKGENKKNLIGGGKDSSSGKVKVTHTSKAKQVINSLLSMGREVFGNLQENKDPSYITWKKRIMLSPAKAQT